MTEIDEFDLLFKYDHLPIGLLRDTSQKFVEMYEFLKTLPRNRERTVAIRKLLEAKDAAVRTHVIGD